MSIKNNSIANYLGQFYSIIIVILVTPFYLKYLGAEAYGLIGFFALIQAWMNLLDMGLSPTLARQVAIARGQTNGFDIFKRLLKSFELIFLVLGLTVILIIFFTSNWIALNWINVGNLKTETVVRCIDVMGVLIGLRWLTGLYRSGMIGLEEQVWLNLANIVFMSLKFIGSLLLLAFISQNIIDFFIYQLAISLLEVLVFIVRFYRRLPFTESSQNLVMFDWQVVKNILPFSLSIAYTAGIWILVTQTDKMVLSGILSLVEFGYFSLVALIAGGITSLSGPITNAILPRMTMLFAEGKKEEMLLIYRQSSQLITLISFSVAIMISFFSEILLFAWTGDKKIAVWGAEILFWFSLGNGLLAIGGFQYMLQNVYGQLRLHVIGSTISVVIQLPVIFFAASYYGAVGAGFAWFCIRLIWFLFWTPVVHNKFAPGFHWKWMFKDILPILVTLIVTAKIFKLLILFDFGMDRTNVFLELFIIGLLMLFLATFNIDFIKNKYKKILR